MGSVVALAGQIGGAKLADGLYRLRAQDLTVIVNTGDDFEHLGLHVSPDVDTLLYTLSGLNNDETGWGRAGETWSFLEELERLGLETWFRIGDRDVAVHVQRTRELRDGRSLTEITANLSRRLGARAAIVPMSDEPVRTVLDTDSGCLPFQEYFVRRRCEPVVRGIRFEGAEQARPSPALAGLLAAPDLDAVVICPSNPFLSIDPILSIPGLPAALAGRGVPVVAVSPVVGGAAIKGPTAKIMRELDIPVTPAAVAEHYRGLIDGFVVDRVDRAHAGPLERAGLTVAVTDTIMRTAADRRALADGVLELIGRLAAGSAPVEE
jgi:LPPG:FO 2-phospho-L-lactate transferase